MYDVTLARPPVIRALVLHCRIREVPASPT